MKIAMARNDVLPPVSASLAAREPATSKGEIATRFFGRPDGQIAYESRGTGPLVVLVPGLGDMRAEYRFLAAPLADAGFRVITTDLRGHGESSTGWKVYTTVAIGSDIVALIEALDAGPALIIGTSMGAGAAAWAAAAAPHRVRGIVLIGPLVREVPLPAWMKALLWIVVRTAFVGPWAAKAWSLYYASLYKLAKPADFDAYLARLVANLKEPGRIAALQGMLRARKTDVEARLGNVRAPTLVIMGSKDPDFPDPAREAAEVARLLRGTAHMIAGAGHYPHVEAPETVAPVIVDFARRQFGP